MVGRQLPFFSVIVPFWLIWAFAGFRGMLEIWKPAEVVETRWADWPSFAGDVLTGRLPVSPWCSLQVAQLNELGPDPSAWPIAAADELPPAARLVQRGG